jgi:endo-1,4-beta-xylanase
MILIFLALISLSWSQTLRQAAQGKHFSIGTASNYQHLTQDSTYASTLSQQYNLVTAENECKWAATEPGRGQYNFAQCDALLRSAISFGQKFRGHNLCWGEGNPNWLQNGAFSPTEKRAILQDHITTVVKRYNSTPICWDVVNEAVADSGSALYKNNVWYPDIPDYVDFAFKTAKAANPTVKLYYNDYNIASATGFSQQKSDKVYNMIKSMKQRGIPIDGIGFQLHVDITYNLFPGIIQNIQRYAALGLEVQFTELDVGCATYGQTCSSWDAQKEQTQASIYSSLLNVCSSQPACTNFETWGFTDKYSWLGANDHPLPFDANYNKKPAFNSLLQGLLNENQ